MTGRAPEPLRQQLAWPRQAPLVVEVAAGSRRPGGIQRLIIRVFNGGESPVRAGRPSLVHVPGEARPRTLIRAHRACHVPARSCIRYILAMPLPDGWANDPMGAYRLTIPRRPWGVISVDITPLVAGLVP